MSDPPPQTTGPQQLEALLPLLMMLAPELAAPLGGAAAAPAPPPAAPLPSWPPSAQPQLPAGLPAAQLGDAAALLPLLGAGAGMGTGRQQAPPAAGGWPPPAAPQQEWLRVPSPPPPLPQQAQLGTLDSLREVLLPALRDPLLPHQRPPAASAFQPAWAMLPPQPHQPWAPPPLPPPPQQPPQLSPALRAAAQPEHASAFGSPTPAPSPPPAPGALDDVHDVHDVHDGHDAALPFQPVATRSVQAALASAAPAGLIRGAREQSGVYQVWIHYAKKQAFVGRLDRRGAATAADLVLTWQRHCLTRKTAEKAAQRRFNLPGAMYEQDEQLLAQLRQVGSADQMKLFIQAVVPQAPLPAWQHAGAAAAPPAVRTRNRKKGGGGGGHKRKLAAATSSDEQVAPQHQEHMQPVSPRSVPTGAGRRKQAAPRRAPAGEDPSASASVSLEDEQPSPKKWHLDDEGEGPELRG